MTVQRLTTRMGNVDLYALYIHVTSLELLNLKAELSGI
jgi:hypothetical protein